MIKKKGVRSRTLTLTQELVARVERVEPDPGPEPGTSEHTEAELITMVEELLQEHTPQHLWIFAYGSLIWNPEFEVVESRPAVASGWHRSFCLKLTRWRGTRETPALMLALDRGGSCNGLAYRLPPQDHFQQLMLLMVREIDANPPTNIPRWIYVKTGQDTFATGIRSGAPGHSVCGQTSSGKCRAYTGEGGGPLGISCALPFSYRFDASPARH